MDRKLPQTQEIEQLIRRSAASRSCLSSELIAVRQRLDIPARIGSSLKRHPSAWLLGSLISGFVASLFTRRRKAVATVKKHPGLLMTLLGLALTAARPFAKVWVTDQLSNHLRKHPGIIPVPQSRSPRSINPI